MEEKEDEDNIIDLEDPGEQTIMEKIIIFLSFLIVIACPVLLLCCFKVVKQYERAVLFRNGRLGSRNPVGPGLIFRLPCVDDIYLIDTRTQSMDLNPQEAATQPLRDRGAVTARWRRGRRAMDARLRAIEARHRAILTKDSVTVTVNAIIYYYILSPVSCAVNIRNYKYATELLAISVLRNAVGLYDLATVLSNRETLGFQVQKQMGQATSLWGMEVERIVIREVILPFDLQKAMAAEAEGTRLAQAKIIESEGEIRAAESLRQAADILQENPQALLLRYLQTLNFIGSNNRTSIVFPFPVDIPVPDK